ncbi:hypothetical protein PUNSTDRAFT_145800 [Punctularia strigosozonata HHB-11173 SS5]|uniref:uncharacterized protein n=1 Tax=Punctularia strigosozonata (strain HHB-11173) TaxID=741275 RepID=UPI00044168D0|nr:uncharacterized protein PUNSTDRAFT_145800 [Punctularia strigosozonata HHB-11173 SS5]EIN05930.1 hypothetical protein PUNSTDRAFT_145800 [Punctularia strigosozonata HHB-11173 SS5]
MSLGEADAKFPHTHHYGEPPSPSIENPAGVFPYTDPHEAPAGSISGVGDRGRSSSSLLAVGNPFLLQDVLYKVDRALLEAIEAIEGDGGRVSDTDNTGKQETLLAKFERWRDEIDEIRSQTGVQPSRATSRESGRENGYQREGGLFAD